MIIADLNERFGLNLGEKHRLTLTQMMETLDSDVALDASARANTRENVRLTFNHKVNDVIQEIVESIPLPWSFEDLSEHALEERAERIDEAVAREIREPFDLSTGPLVRFKLLKVADDEHVLVINMHHIVSDGWSMGVLNSEITALYGAFAVGRPSPLPDLDVQYADFAHWHREWLTGEEWARQVGYWREQLEGVSTLELPTDHPRPRIQTYAGAIEWVPISPETARALQALCRHEGVTLAMGFLAIFSILMHRYTGQDDIVIGSPIANRSRKEIEGLIGFFVNSLVMRTDVSGDPTARELIHRVRDVALCPCRNGCEALRTPRARRGSEAYAEVRARDNLPEQAHRPKSRRAGPPGRLLRPAPTDSL